MVVEVLVCAAAGKTASRTFLRIWERVRLDIPLIATLTTMVIMNPVIVGGLRPSSSALIKGLLHEKLGCCCACRTLKG